MNNYRFEVVGRLEVDRLNEKIYKATVDGIQTAFLKAVLKNGETTARCYHHVATRKNQLGCRVMEWDDETFAFTGYVITWRSITSMKWNGNFLSEHMG